MSAAPAAKPAPPAQVAGPVETVRLAWIDGLSGAFAAQGQNSLRSFEYLAEVEGRAPRRWRYAVTAYDGKGNKQDSLTALRLAIDQGHRYVVQGASSAVAAALIEELDKHNQRNPGREVLLLNFAAVDPELTNARCSFWHFRFDAETGMRMEAMASALAASGRPQRTVWLINQNYAHGQQVQAFARSALARKLPQARIVGEDLHAVGQVKDFSPYIARMKAAGVDTVITGNWGPDLSLLIKAARDAGFTPDFYTYYANAVGTPTVLGNALAGRIHIVYGSNVNEPGAFQAVRDGFKARHGQDYSMSTIHHLYRVLGAALDKAGSSQDTVRVAQALEGLSVPSFNGEVTMRAADHQLQQPLVHSVWQARSQPGQWDVEGTGMTWVEARRFAPWVTSLPTSCAMQRPAGVQAARAAAPATPATTATPATPATGASAAPSRAEKPAAAAAR